MQSQTTREESHDAILRAGERLYNLAKDLQITDVEKKLPDYTKEIEQYFINVKKDDLISADIDKLKILLNMHDKILHVLINERENVSIKLKQLHTGKSMQSLYPQNISQP